MLRNEYPVKILRHTAGGDAALLDLCVAVGHDKNFVLRVQLPQRLFAVRHKIALRTQFAEIRSVERRRVGFQTVFRKKDAEAFDIKCLFRNLPAFKALPELRIEFPVVCPHLRRERQVEGTKRDGERVPGTGLKVK